MTCCPMYNGSVLFTLHFSKDLWATLTRCMRPCWACCSGRPAPWRPPLASSASRPWWPSPSEASVWLLPPHPAAAPGPGWKKKKQQHTNNFILETLPFDFRFIHHIPQDFTDRDVLLHLFSLRMHLADPLLLLLQARLQVVQDLLQLLLPGGQTGSHLFGLRAQLRLGLQLLLKS